jgi:hypothetical protein
MYDDFIEEYDGLGIYTPQSGQEARGGHAIKIIGWGDSYWIAANSWGRRWGRKGYFHIAMGNALLQLEQNHICLIPAIPHIRENTVFQRLGPENLSLVRELDTQLRRLDEVNPYTLYTIGATQAMQDGLFRGNAKNFMFYDGILRPPKSWTPVYTSLLLISLMVVLYVVLKSTF